MLALVALAVLVNRPNFPSYLLAEFYLFNNESLELFVRRPATRFQGSTTLLLSDSMLRDAPWRTDLVAVPATPTADLGSQFREHVADRRYTHIVLWAGTFDWMERNSADATVAAIQSLAADLQEYTDHVIVLGVMPQMQPDGSYAPTPQQAAGITDRLRESCPGARVVDVLPILLRAEREQRRAEIFSDSVHLTLEGFRLLEGLLETEHLQIAEDQELVALLERITRRRERERAVFPAGR